MTPPPPTIESPACGVYGYASRAYADSLAEFGDLVELSASGGWLLERSVPGSNEGSDARDGMGCYPLLACRRWDALSGDLDSLADRLVCVWGVTDPLADAAPELLSATFPDVCYEYKQHFIVDLERPLDNILPSHHRRNVRKAVDALEVREAAPSAELLETWQSLYDTLVDRHGITGIARFSSRAFERQMLTPGFVAFAAYDRERLCGMTLWYHGLDAVYYHLAAYDDIGYDLGASYALFWHALRHFAKLGVKFAALGAGAGATASESGLTRFKRGWATETRPAYFCGRVLQPESYRRLTGVSSDPTNYFPAYRRA